MDDNGMDDNGMDDKDSLLKKTEAGIKEAAKAVEEFADKVAAPEEPLIIVPTKKAPPPDLPAAKPDLPAAKNG